MSNFNKRDFLKYSIVGLVTAGPAASLLSTASASDKMPQSKDGPSKDDKGDTILRAIAQASQQK
jgi:hypothetical protein